MRLLAAALLVGVLMGCSATVPATPVSSPSPTVERVRVIVELVSPDVADAVLATVADVATDVRRTSSNLYLIMVVPRPTIEVLRANPQVRKVTEDFADSANPSRES